MREWRISEWNIFSFTVGCGVKTDILGHDVDISVLGTNPKAVASFLGGLAALGHTNMNSSSTADVLNR